MDVLKIATRVATAARDVTKEFLSMKRWQFSKFIDSLENEPHLQITVDIGDLNQDHDAMDMKIFLESIETPNQRRTATIRMTLLQKLNRDSRTVNAMASGVKWERIEDPETDLQAEKIIADRGY